MRKRAELSRDVLVVIARHLIKDGVAPSVREIMQEMGYPSFLMTMKAINRLIAVGVLEWPVGPNGKRVASGIKLADGLLREPVRVPILPGNRVVEIYQDGQILVDGKEYEVWTTTSSCQTESAAHQERACT